MYDQNQRSLSRFFSNFKFKIYCGMTDQPGVKEFKILRQVNESVKVPPHGYDNLLCAVVTVGDTFCQAQELAEHALNSIECVIA